MKKKFELIPISELSSSQKKIKVEEEKLKHAKSYIKDNDHEWDLTTFSPSFRLPLLLTFAAA